MDSIATFHHKKTVVAETVGFRSEADVFKSAPIFLGFVCHVLHRVFRYQKMVVAESVGFRSEADLFKSVQIIQGSGGHDQH